jgi:hypothetical protein
MYCHHPAATSTAAAAADDAAAAASTSAACIALPLTPIEASIRSIIAFDMCDVVALLGPLAFIILCNVC